MGCADNEVNGSRLDNRKSYTLFPRHNITSLVMLWISVSVWIERNGQRWKLAGSVTVLAKALVGGVLRPATP
jgi:hypothetical protein